MVDTQGQVMTVVNTQGQVIRVVDTQGQVMTVIDTPGLVIRVVDTPGRVIRVFIRGPAVGLLSRNSSDSRGPGKPRLLICVRFPQASS